jgi:hypothetical protein
MTRRDASAWPYPILWHLRGELDEAGLLAAAGQDQHRQAEVRCDLGLKALRDGRDDAAAEHFRWVKEQCDARVPQSVVSAAELERLLANEAEGDGP